MITKATNSVLNLVNPPIDHMVLLQGTFDDVTIGAHVPNIARFTQITDAELTSPLVGAPAGRLTEVFVARKSMPASGLLAPASISGFLRSCHSSSLRAPRRGSQPASPSVSAPIGLGVKTIVGFVLPLVWSSEALNIPMTFTLRGADN
jgi:hypothetical protein